MEVDVMMVVYQPTRLARVWRGCNANSANRDTSMTLRFIVDGCFCWLQLLPRKSPNTPSNCLVLPSTMATATATPSKPFE